MKILLITAGALLLLAAQAIAQDLSGTWAVEQVAFAPWILKLNVDGGKVRGTVRQGPRYRTTATTTSLTQPVEIRNGIVNGAGISFEVQTPDGTGRVLHFQGKFQGNEIAFTRDVEAADGRDPKRTGLFGPTGDAKFTAKRDSDAAQQARALLERTVENYFSTEQWKIEGALDWTLTGPGLPPSGELAFKFASKSQTETRNEESSGLLATQSICDGKTKWVYSPAQNIYSERALPGACTAPLQTLRALTSLSSPVVAGMDMAKFGGAEVPCTVVHADIEGARDAPQAPTGVRLPIKRVLCIDPVRAMLLRDESHAKGAFEGKENALTVDTLTTYFVIEKMPDNLADPLFRFAPPQGAKPGSVLAPSLPSIPMGTLPKPPADGVLRMGGAVSAPTLIKNPEPSYSEDARKAKVEGTVLLQLVVREDGNPSDIHVVRPLFASLDQKAIEAVSNWRFSPGMKDGKAVPVLVSIQVTFRLVAPKK